MPGQKGRPERESLGAPTALDGRMWAAQTYPRAPGKCYCYLLLSLVLRTTVAFWGGGGCESE